MESNKEEDKGIGTRGRGAWGRRRKASGISAPIKFSEGINNPRPITLDVGPNSFGIDVSPDFRGKEFQSKPFWQ